MVPELRDPEARKAIMKLTRGLSLSLQWEFTNDTLNEIDECITLFHSYCRRKRDACNLSISVFRPVMHYLSHISWIIKRQGPLVVYSTRSQER